LSRPDYLVRKSIGRGLEGNLAILETEIAKVVAMRVAILTGSGGWHIRDLQRAGSELGYSVDVVNFCSLQGHLSPFIFTVPNFANFDSLIIRTMPLGTLDQIIFRMNLLQGWASAGYHIVNSPPSLELCIDKFLSLLRLQQMGIPVPKTIACESTDDAMNAFASLGSDVVVKPVFGSEGRGLIRLTDTETAWRTFKAIEKMQSLIYLQEFIPHGGWDIRAFVLQGKILGAIRRNNPLDWRTNVAQGATAEPYELTHTESDLALRAAHAMGTHVAGVDLLPCGEKRLVVEVNGVPGWKALSQTLQIDVAKELLLSLRKPNPVSPPEYAYLACLWEATARKAGNVHPSASFANMGYTDFVRSAEATAPEMAKAPSRSLGENVLASIRATKRGVQPNTNLGIVLLLAPLAMVPEGVPLREGVEKVLASTTIHDSELVFEAIRLAIPGGLGKSDKQDVSDRPTLPLREIMGFATDRDNIARQYQNGFADVFEIGLPALLECFEKTRKLEPSIQYCQLKLLQALPDTLIARKLGIEEAQKASQFASEVLAQGFPESEQSQLLYREFDTYLRARGNQRNPGTTADLVTACLYVGLRTHRIDKSAVL